MAEMTPQVAERKAQLKQELARFVRVLSADATVERLIVFGSMATGALHEWSDIDLVVVKQTDLPFYKRLTLAYRTLRPTIETDVVVYTPAEFAQMAKSRWFVRDEILPKGALIYERSSV